jgi:hypothetical protein
MVLRAQHRGCCAAFPSTFSKSATRIAHQNFDDDENCRRICSKNWGLGLMLTLSWRRFFLELVLTFALAVFLFAPLWWALQWVLKFIAKSL